MVLFKMSFHSSHFICVKLLGELNIYKAEKNGFLMGFPPNIGTFDNYSLRSKQIKDILGKEEYLPMLSQERKLLLG